MKPGKLPGWMTSGAPKNKKSRPATESVKSITARREREGKEFERRRKSLIKPGSDPPTYPTQGELADLMCVQRNTITRWEGGKLEIPRWAGRLLGYIEKDPLLTRIVSA